MTQSTDTGDRWRVLRVYRLYRARYAPYIAMRRTQDHFAWLTAHSVQCGALDAAQADARCFSVADMHRVDIDERSRRMPYWISGKYTAPIPPEVIDHCLICRATHEDHEARVRFHAFQSSL